MNDPNFTGGLPESVERELELPVSIKQRDAVGDDGYNGGCPHKFTVKRW